MEGSADLEGQAALGARRLGQFRRTVHSSLLAADDQLTGAVVVADLHHALGRSLVAAGLQLVPVKGQHRGHAAVNALGRLGHGLAPEGCQFHGGGGVKDACRLQGGILAQRKACRVLGPNPCRVQRRGNTRRKSHHAGLGILGLVDDPIRVVKADGFQIEIQLGSVKSCPEVGAALIEIAAHAGMLAALARVQKCQFHQSTSPVIQACARF